MNECERSRELVRRLFEEAYTNYRPNTLNEIMAPDPDD